MRTLSVTGRDLDGEIVDALPALVQRVEQRLQFWLGTWFLNRHQGVNYRSDVFGQRQFIGLAQQAITDQILSFEGEVTGVDDITVELDNDTRVMTYLARVSSIYGQTSISGELG